MDPMGEKNGSMTGLLILALCMGMFLAGTSPAHAHKVVVFAWVEDGRVYTESKFAGGRKAKNARVMVYDKNGAVLVTGTTDKDGAFSFPIPVRDEMRVVLKAGMGHQGQWVIPASEFATASEPDAKQTVYAKGMDPDQTAETSVPAVTAAPENRPACPSLDEERLRQMIDATLDRKLQPISRSLHQLQNPDHNPTLADILGGIGYILGLVGLGSYMQARRRNEKGDGR